MYYNIVDVMAQGQLKRGFKKWGIERTEEKIKEVYSNLPKIREHMLKNYDILIGRKENEIQT